MWLTTAFQWLVFGALVHFWIKHQRSFWKRYGVCSVKGGYILGNMKKFWKRHIGESTTECYRKLKHHDIIGGFYCFLRPVLLIMQPQLIGRILDKDAAQFIAPPTLRFSTNLLTVEGRENKRKLRRKITPTLTNGGRLKLWFDEMLQVGAELNAQLTSAKRKPVAVNEISLQFTTGILAKCVLRRQSNRSNFFNLIQKLTKPSWIKRVKFAFLDTFGELGRVLRVKWVNEKHTAFFMKILGEEKEGETKNRDDVINTLLKISRPGVYNGHGDDNNNTATEDICAEALLLATSHEIEKTTAALVWCLYELGTSANDDVQDKLINEVKIVLGTHRNVVTYEAIEEMTYLHQVVLETLRLHPPVSSIRRVALENYQVPDSTHIITKGTLIEVPVHAIHHDPEYYPQPEAFNPDRFTELEIAHRPEYTFLASRDCLGTRFSLLQIKIALVSVLRKYRLRVNEAKTSRPMKVNPKSAVTSVKNKVWIDLEEHE